ncbi:MAG TPA: ThuA domain-containing protein [Verrucomicrobiae bacterium]|nr:ThuA domain-containing protein [Verrucomicrobiae bacterium]
MSVAATAAPKKLLVVTATQGFRHSSIPLAEKVLAGLGEETGLFTVDYARGGADGKGSADLNEKLSPDSLKNYDGVIFANTTGDLPLPDRDAFIAWVKSGKAFIGTHSASDTFHGYPLYIEMLGGEFLTHHAQAGVECINMDRNSPATRNLGAKYSVFDEIYLLKNFHRDQVHGLLTLDKHPNTGIPGDYPIAWCKQFGEGKVFYTSLGHREDVWLSDSYQKHLLGGIEWALGIQRGQAEPQNTKARLSKAEFDDGFKILFDGTDLNGWKLRHADGTNSWSVQNGMLVNVPEPHGNDLVSEENFRDFVVRYDYMVPTNSNSGLYLRGRYEIQILEDSQRKKPDVGGNGAIYHVAAPTEFVTRPSGQWQTAQATIKGNKISLILNGVKVHDNFEVTQATGGALDSNLDQAGPIMLQGDHGAIAFRNIRIKALE